MRKQASAEREESSLVEKIASELPFRTILTRYPLRDCDFPRRHAISGRQRREQVYSDDRSCFRELFVIIFTCPAVVNSNRIPGSK